VELVEQIQREYEHGAGTIRAVAKAESAPTDGAASFGQRAAAGEKAAGAGTAEVGSSEGFYRRDIGRGPESASETAPYSAPDQCQDPPIAAGDQGG